jgi:hypothetical protein
MVSAVDDYSTTLEPQASSVSLGVGVLAVGAMAAVMAPVQYPNSENGFQPSNHPSSRPSGGYLT